MPVRMCLDCSRLTTATRCPDCNASRGRTPQGARIVSKAERARRAATVANYRAQHGNVCVGYNRSAHHATDLTADHLHPVGAGGSEGGPLGVLCRSCNGRKQART